MKQTLSIIALLALPAFGFAQTALTAAAPPEAEAPMALTVLDAQGVLLDSFKWVSRPVVVFADSPDDPRFDEQMSLLLDRPEALLERDVVVITDTDPAARSAWRTKLRPRGFMLVLIGKDGEIELRKPTPWHVRELTRVIDKMPLRQQEIRDKAALGG